MDKPAGLVLDTLAQILYVSERGSHCIRRLDLATALVSTLAGSGGIGKQDGVGARASFNAPIGLALHAGMLYVADNGNHTIRRIDLSKHLVTTLAGNGSPGYTNGTGTAATFSRPWGMVCNGTHLFVADYGNHTIRQVTFAGAVTTVVGNGQPGKKDGQGLQAGMKNPTGLALLHGTLYITDNGNYAIREYRNGTVTTLLGNGLGQDPTKGLISPVGLSATSHGVFVVDAFRHQVRKLR
jgi:hypothetical protein